MLKIRLKRIGRKHDPSFRIVVTEATAPPKGRYKEAVGFYNSALKQLKMDKERIGHWLSVGAQPTSSVHNLLVKEGVVDAPKQKAHSTRVRKQKEGKSSGPAPVAESPQEGESQEEVGVKQEDVKNDAPVTSQKEEQATEAPVVETEKQVDDTPKEEGGKKEESVEKESQKEAPKEQGEEKD